MTVKKVFADTAHRLSIIVIFILVILAGLASLLFLALGLIGPALGAAVVFCALVLFDKYVLFPKRDFEDDFLFSMKHFHDGMFLMFSLLNVTIGIITLVIALISGTWAKPITAFALFLVFLLLYSFLTIQKKKNRAEKDAYVILSCPRCFRSVRVPQGKGKIVITCPECRAEFMHTT